MGAGHTLFPDGIENTTNLPSDLSVALSQALLISSWHEHLGEKEMPPEWMWTLPWELEVWFERVDYERKQKYGGGDDGDDDHFRESDDDLVNEYAAELRGQKKRR